MRKVGRHTVCRTHEELNRQQTMAASRTRHLVPAQNRKRPSPPHRRLRIPQRMGGRKTPAKRNLREGRQLLLRGDHLQIRNARMRCRRWRSREQEVNRPPPEALQHQKDHHYTLLCRSKRSGRTWPLPNRRRPYETDRLFRRAQGNVDRPPPSSTLCRLNHHPTDNRLCPLSPHVRTRRGAPSRAR